MPWSRSCSPSSVCFVEHFQQCKPCIRNLGGVFNFFLGLWPSGSNTIISFNQNNLPGALGSHCEADFSWVLVTFAPPQTWANNYNPRFAMVGTVFHPIRSPVKRVTFEAKQTTRGIRYKQSPVKSKPSPLRRPSKNAQPAQVEIPEDVFSEPLIQYKGKVRVPADARRVEWNANLGFLYSRRMTTSGNLCLLSTSFYTQFYNQRRL
jgi:hypothetical protein